MATAAQIPGKRMGDGQREAHRDRRVDGVAALLQYGHPDVGRDRLHGHDHAMARPQGLPATSPVHRDGEQEHQQHDWSHPA